MDCGYSFEVNLCFEPKKKKKEKVIKYKSTKIVSFTTIKIRSILHSCIIVMFKLIFVFIEVCG